MAKFKSKYPMNPNSVVLKPTDDFDVELHPKFNADAIFIDEHTVGPLYDVYSRKAFNQKELSAFQLWEEIKRHGTSINPVTKLPRIIGLLLKLEEMGLKGDIEAIKLFLDRVVGKQPDNLVMNLTKYEGLSDRDLLDMVHSDNHQNVAQLQEPSSTASNSQESGKI